MAKQNVQAKNNSRRTIWLILCLLLLAAAGTAAVLLLRRPAGATVVATVNGVPITRAELEMLMEDQRGQVRNHFTEELGADYQGADFWTTPVDGVTPMEYAREQAYSQMVDIKLQQILMQEYGLTDDISYASFEKRLNAENQRRKTVREEGGVIYGVYEYTPIGLFREEFDGLTEKLQEALQEDGSLLTGETSAWLYYQSHPEQFVIPAAYQIRAVYTPIPALSSEDGLDEAAYLKLKAFADRLAAGEDFDALVEEVKAGKLEGLRYLDINYNEETDLMEVEVVAELVKVLPDLAPGQPSSIVTYPHFYYTLGCYTSMVPEKARPFDDAGSQKFLSRILTEQGYEALLAKRRDEAQLVKTAAFSTAELPLKFR